MDGATTDTTGAPVPEEPPTPAEPDGWLGAFLTPAVPDPPPEVDDGAPAPADVAAGEDAAARHGRSTDPLAVATMVGIASFLLGGGLVLWRNRPSRFWPA